ncbi:sigma-54-dependent transcriptional regulator [Anaerotignum sp.]|uniref:sigma-54-dependent transcriptional regulator n=1 Tax=Anaerotignum sp. TaxID=2039241 RepID=UPI0027148CBD|nr:sigma-54 dependent transcriptional regulator [Anaerotignum sp.]
MSDLFKILVVDDEADARESMQMLLNSVGYQVKTAQSVAQALNILEMEYYPLVITDIMMPGLNGIELLNKIKESYKENIEVIMVTGYGSIETAVQTIKLGAFSYLMKGSKPEELLLDIKKAKSLIELKAEQYQNIKQRNKKFHLTSKNSKMQEVWELVNRVADSNANVLITGETGVGKEIVAEEIHLRSRRSNKLFIPLNCQNYPDKLIESELFGHEKGAFTGAVTKRVGKIEAGNGGTIFLDEIGEMSLATQVTLLRVLEAKQIERIGSNRLIDVDFRLVSATNRNLHQRVKEGLFREDFLYRINTIEIKIPPLRERKEDIPSLIDFFIRKYVGDTGKHIQRIDKDTEKFLMEYDYYGNIREMKNMIERMVLLSRDGILRLSETLDVSGPQTRNARVPLLPYKEAKQNFERQYISAILESCDNNISRAAEKMKMSRRQLFNKIQEYKIETK